MKWLSNLYRFNDKTLSRKGLLWVWFLATLSVPCFPLLLLLRYSLAEEVPMLIPLQNAVDGPIGIGILILSFAALCGLGLSRIVNRFWVTDTYLDEWEIEMKRASMAFTFQVTTLFWVGVFTASIILKNLNVDIIPPAELSWMSVSIIFVMTSVYTHLFYLLAHLRSIDAEHSGEIAA